MKTNSMKKWLSLLLCIALIAATALLATGCNDAPANTGSDAENPDSSASSGTESQDTTGAVGPTVKGEGNTVFTFVTVDKNGVKTEFEIHTDEKTVGAALTSLNLIAGEMGDYGLFIQSVLGQTLDWDKDGMYWAFYIDGEYALTGVDQTDIVAGKVYTIQADKG